MHYSTIIFFSDNILDTKNQTIHDKTQIIYTKTQKIEPPSPKFDNNAAKEKCSENVKSFFSTSHLTSHAKCRIN